MKKILILGAALALGLGATQASMAQGDRGRHDDKAGHDKDHGRNEDKGRSEHGPPAEARNPGHDDHAAPQPAADHAPPGKAERRRDEDRRPDANDERRQTAERDRDGDHDRDGEHDRDRDRDRDLARDSDRDRPDRVIVVRPAPDRRESRVITERSQIVILQPRPDRGLINGCPPGLARKNNGCTPPGHAKPEPVRHDWVWRPYQTNAYDYRYDNGYLYQYNKSGSLLGYLPALAGALGVGSTWPQQYQYQPVPSYYSNYYGLNQPYDYRYANGALYGVNPQTNAIQQVAALLTGQTPQLGQPMPAGYDVYNVPYAYRAQYADTPQAQYRYNDGYVYQVDPTTRLVQAVIQLLA